jgi:uncharacterized metal-binding protein YceD (DUF177 family)
MAKQEAKPYEINVAALSEGRHQFAFVLSDNFLDHFSREYVSSIETLNVLVELDKLPYLITVSLTVKGVLEVPCSLCTKPFRMEVERKGLILYTFEESFKQKEADAIYYLTPSCPIINIGQDIYDYLCLSLPIRLIPDECQREPCDPVVRRYLQSEENEDAR